jgi:hypothetical protein
LERISRATCSTLSTSAFGAPSNSRCASSKKKTSFGLVRVAHLGQLLEELGQQPQQEGRVEPRRAHQPVGHQDVDPPRPSGVGRIRSASSSAGSPKKRGRALVLEHQQLALDRADEAGDVAVAQRQLARVLAEKDQHRLQVLEVEQRQPLLVGDAEGDVEHALLRLGQLQQARQQQRPHLGHRGAHRVALLAEEVPEHHREALVG